MGEVTNVVHRRVPASYVAMVGATNSYYSLTLLQDLADFVKYRLFSTVVEEGDEGSTYNRKEVELLGILTTLQFIPAAVDYWGSQIASQGAGNVGENESFFDRRADLWKIFGQLQAEAAELSQELGLFYKAAKLPGVSYGDNGRDVLVTADPECFPPLHRKRTTYGPYWSDWS